MEARLAPFYRGLEDYDEDFTEESIGKILDELKEKDYEEGVANSVVEAMKAEREPTGTVGTVTKKIKIHRARDTRLEEEKAERDKRERRAYLGAVECPICFLVCPTLLRVLDDLLKCRTTLPTSTPLDAANNPSALNALFKLSGAKRLSRISSLIPRAAHSVWRPTLV